MIFRLVKAGLFIFCLFVAYAFGIISMRYNFYPVGELYLKPEAIKQVIDDYRYQSGLKGEHSKILRIYEEATHPGLRSEIAAKLIIPDRKYVSMAHDCSICANNVALEHHTVTTYDTVHNAHYYYNRRKKSTRLVIYLQGHGGSPYEHDYALNILSQVTKRGDSMLLMSMTGLGLNQGPASFSSTLFGKDITRKLPKERAAQHQFYAEFRDSTQPDLIDIAIMISGNYHLVKEISESYTDIDIVGVSGGGWYSVFLAALLPEIDNTYSYAGSLPMVYRVIKSNKGDFEQYDSLFWQDYDYYHLYFLSVMDKNNDATRKLHLVYHSKDECCMRDPYASEFKNMMTDFISKRLDVTVLNQRAHKINEYHLLSQLYVE